MAGYIGTKAVNLSTTAANVGGDADIGGALDVGGAFTSQGIDDNATSTAMTLDASGNVGIGTASPSGASGTTLAINGGSGQTRLALKNTNTGDASGDGFQISIGTDGSAGIEQRENNYMAFLTNASERMRVDDSGNLLVGKTAESFGTQGVAFRGSPSAGASGSIFTRDGENVAAFNRLTSDGNIVSFNKNGTTVGSIGVSDGDRLNINSGTLGLKLYDDGKQILPSNGSGGNSDNVVDLGSTSVRFDDIYATNGTIQTSDRNEKQDIAELSDAEQRVAVAAKGLMRKFRWRDAVEAKGDNARTHFGIIAQDLQAAFAAEELDAGDYAMFISTTWWEHDVEVPAVEAVAEVLDEEGNVVTEAVEAADAYTRTDTYDTQEEAPEGATERTRLGVRYSELLAFIIGA